MIISAFASILVIRLKNTRRNVVTHTKATWDFTFDNNMIWVEIMYCVAMYCAIIPINNFTSDILQVKFGLSSLDAGYRFGEIYLTCGVTLLMVGWFNDKYGHIASTQIVAALCCLLGNLWWTYYPCDCLVIITWPPVLAMGMAYGLMAGTTWNVIVYLVKGQRVGTAIGITSCLVNIGTMVTPLVMGYLKDTTTLDFGYYYVSRVSLSLSLLALFISTVIYYHDCVTTKMLSMSVEARNNYNKNK